MQLPINSNTTHIQISYKNEVLQLRQQLADIQVIVHNLTNRINTLYSSKKEENKITLAVNGGYEIIKADAIVLCEASGNYTKVFVKNDDNTIAQILISKTLKSIETRMDSKNHIRCHQSFLVQLDFVKGYNHKKGLSLLLKNNRYIPVSRRHTEQVMRILT